MAKISLPRLPEATALLGAAILGLAPVEVRATQVIANPCSFGGNPAFDLCATNAPVSVGDKLLTLLEIPSVGSGTLEFFTPPAAPAGVQVLEYDFLPPLNASAGIGRARYKVSITQPNTIFTFIITGIDAAGPGGSLTTSLYSDNSFSNASLIETITTGDADGIPLTTPFSEIWIENDYQANEGGALNSVILQFIQGPTAPPAAVPGPLPLLGAGTAFGFSRRLRRRVKRSLRLG